MFNIEINGKKRKESNKSKLPKPIKVFGLLSVAILVFFALGFGFKMLWNVLIPDIFGFSEITYWQGIGLLVLAKLIFGGISTTSNSGSRSSHSARSEDVDNNLDKMDVSRNESEIKVEEGLVSDSEISNEEQEALYEKWWDQEGEKLFENFVDGDK